MNRTQNLVEQRVTYTLEMDGRLYVIENVPARVDEETGEQFFAPSTVECLREVILSEARPKRIRETPVYEYPEERSVQSYATVAPNVGKISSP